MGTQSALTLRLLLSPRPSSPCTDSSMRGRPPGSAGLWPCRGSRPPSSPPPASGVDTLFCPTTLFQRMLSPFISFNPSSASPVNTGVKLSLLTKRSSFVFASLLLAATRIFLLFRTLMVTEQQALLPEGQTRKHAMVAVLIKAPLAFFVSAFHYHASAVIPPGVLDKYIEENW